MWAVRGLFRLHMVLAGVLLACGYGDPSGSLTSFARCLALPQSCCVARVPQMQ
jgi:hypothetical protein